MATKDYNKSHLNNVRKVRKGTQQENKDKNKEKITRRWVKQQKMEKDYVKNDNNEKKIKNARVYKLQNKLWCSGKERKVRLFFSEVI